MKFVEKTGYNEKLTFGDLEPGDTFYFLSEDNRVMSELLDTLFIKGYKVTIEQLIPNTKTVYFTCLEDGECYDTTVGNSVDEFLVRKIDARIQLP